MIPVCQRSGSRSMSSSRGQGGDPLRRDRPRLHPAHDAAEALAVGAVMGGRFAEIRQRPGGSVQHPGLHRAGPQHNDRDAQHLYLHAQRIGIFVQRRLADGVESRKGQRVQDRQLAGGDKDAGARLEQGQKNTVHPADGEEIDFKNALDLLVAQLHQGAQVIHPRHVDDAVQTVRPGADRVESRLHAVLIRQVGGQIDQPLAGRRRVPVQSKHAPALPDQPPCRRIAHSPGPAGDQRPLHHFSFLPDGTAPGQPSRRAVFISSKSPIHCP